jgi:hypothetical protein
MAVIVHEHELALKNSLRKKLIGRSRVQQAIQVIGNDGGSNVRRDVRLGVELSLAQIERSDTQEQIHNRFNRSGEPDLRIVVAQSRIFASQPMKDDGKSIHDRFPAG